MRIGGAFLKSLVGFCKHRYKGVHSKFNIYKGIEGQKRIRCSENNEQNSFPREGVHVGDTKRWCWKMQVRVRLCNLCPAHG